MGEDVFGGVGTVVLLGFIGEEVEECEPIPGLDFCGGEGNLLGFGLSPVLSLICPPMLTVCLRLPSEEFLLTDSGEEAGALLLLRTRLPTLLKLSFFN